MKFRSQKISALILVPVLTLSSTLSSVAMARRQAVGETANGSTARPPQFIMLSYDGSYNLDAWEAIRNISKRQKAEGKNTHFTFFASGVYFIPSANKMSYQGPRHAAGRSDIGFGGSVDEISRRIDEMNAAYAEGHEIGSHANGHFDGSTWSTAEWVSEFNQFEKFIFDIFSLNKIDPKRNGNNGWLFTKSDLKGFRAPLLGTSPGMYETLKARNYAYDCSKTASTDYWPEKLSSGMWNFPLAMLRVAGTGKKTLSMDYNFYVAQSGAKPMLQNKELFSQQMYDTYMAWFQKNYNGNRAPMNIGHHFSSWNGGAYFSAYNRFAEKVCGLPEVRCVTYGEYIKWAERLSPGTLASYRAGAFEKAPPIQVAKVSDEPADSSVSVALKTDSEGREMLVARAQTGQPIEGLTARLSVNGQLLAKSRMYVDELKQNISNVSKVPVTAHLYNNQGVEIARSTQTVGGLGTNETTVSAEAEELRALKGDLPEAHYDERAPFIVPNF